MLHLRLGWRNLWRNPRRTAIELASLAGAVFLCMFVIGMQAGMYPQYIQDAARAGSGHVGFYRQGYLELRQADMTFPADGLVKALEARGGVETVLARVHLPGLARSSRDARAASMLGLDFGKEKPVNPLLRDRRIVAGRLPSPDAPWEAAIGADLARELGLRLGQKFVWMSQGPKGETVSRLFRVSGLLKSGIPELDRSAVLAHRRSAARLLGGEDRVHEVAVLIDDYRRADAFLESVRPLAAGLGGVEPVAWDKAMPQIADGIKLDRRGGYVFLSLLLVLVGIGTANTMLMSVLERAREFGVLRALGLKPSGIVRMVLAEGLVLGVFGSALGIGAGAALGLRTSLHGIDFSRMLGEGQEFGGIFVDPVVHTGWDPARTAALAGIMAALALLASLYPTWRAVKIRPSEAMRTT